MNHSVLMLALQMSHHADCLVSRTSTSTGTPKREESSQLPKPCWLPVVNRRALGQSRKWRPLGSAARNDRVTFAADASS